MGAGQLHAPGGLRLRDACYLLSHWIGTLVTVVSQSSFAILSFHFPCCTLCRLGDLLSWPLVYLIPCYRTIPLYYNTLATLISNIMSQCYFTPYRGRRVVNAR